MKLMSAMEDQWNNFGMVLFRTPQFIQRIRIGLMYTGTPTHIISLICSILGASALVLWKLLIGSARVWIETIGGAYLIIRSTFLLNTELFFETYASVKPIIFERLAPGPMPFLPKRRIIFFVALPVAFAFMDAEIFMMHLLIYCAYVPRTLTLSASSSALDISTQNLVNTLRWRCLHYWRKFCLRKVFEGLSGPEFYLQIHSPFNIAYNPTSIPLNSASLNFVSAS